MKNILVPLGSNKNAKSTLQYAVNFASVMNARVIVFMTFGYVSNEEQTEDDVDSTSKLKEIIKEIPSGKTDIKAIAAKGHALENIVSVNKTFPIDLIISAPRSVDVKDAYFVGKTVGGIIKQTDIPVLIVPENYEFAPIKKVLTAIKSGVIRRENALTPLQEIVSLFSAKMHLLQIKTPEFLPEDLQFFSDLASITSSYNSSENATLYQGVLEHINTINPDILCVFRRKRGFFNKLWEEDAIKKVDFESRIPLLVLKGVN